MFTSHLPEISVDVEKSPVHSPFILLQQFKCFKGDKETTIMIRKANLVKCNDVIYRTSQSTQIELTLKRKMYPHLQFLRE